MVKVKFHDSNEKVNVKLQKFETQNGGIGISLKGVDGNTSGFDMYMNDTFIEDCGNYTTVYEERNGFISYSNDGSVYVETVVEVVEPTAEEIAAQQKEALKSSLNAQLSELEKQLFNMDYKFIRDGAEYALAGKTKKMAQADIIQLSNERDSIRDQIDEVRQQIAELE